MKEQFVLYELALKLKELGFDETCLAEYYNEELYIPNYNGVIPCYSNIDAPLWQQAFDWFREKHDMHSKINCWHKDAEKREYWFEISYRYDDSSHGTSSIAKSLFEMDYEKARLECLIELIQIYETTR